MLDVQIGRYHRQVPTAWNQLSEKQLLQVCHLHSVPFLQPSQRDRAFLQVLFQVPARTMRRLNVVQFVELKPLARFLVEPDGFAPLTKQLLPRLPVLHWRQFLAAPATLFYGPRESFRNLTFTEFIYADTYFLRYLQSSDEQWLNQLVAVLYRPQRQNYAPRSVGYQGDRREDFNEHLVEARAGYVAHVPHHVKYAVLLWYRGCRRELERRYARVFSGENQHKATQSGWQQVLFSLADGVHRVDVTSRQLLHNVMREMQRVLENHDRAKEAQQAH